MENPNHLNEPNEAIPEVNPVVPEPNQVVDIHDPNKMVDIPDDIDLVDYDEEDPEEDPKEDPEEEPEEDVDIELEDDAELIFPYEVEGDKTLPPGDVSSDSVSSDYESEDEEVDVAPEATIGTITQKPYAIRDFPRGLFEVGESSSARDSSNVDGLAPWALRRDLEASRAQARVMEAELDPEEDPEKDPEEEPKEEVEIDLEDDVELIFPYEVKGDKTPPPGDVSSDSMLSDSESEDEEVNVAPEATTRTITKSLMLFATFRGAYLRRDLEASRAQARVMEAELGTCQTEITLLKSKNKIGEKERELLNHDLENLERDLGNFLKRISVLESGENATLKKRLAKTETKLAWASMEHDTAERRLHES
ncbi:hypothetical protein Tco_1282250 [Tanacetum coccineum]